MQELVVVGREEEVRRCSCAGSRSPMMALAMTRQSLEAADVLGSAGIEGDRELVGLLGRLRTRGRGGQHWGRESGSLVGRESVGRSDGLVGVSGRTGSAA